jgi:hypothetical protein
MDPGPRVQTSAATNPAVMQVRRRQKPQLAGGLFEEDKKQEGLCLKI